MTSIKSNTEYDCNIQPLYKWGSEESQMTYMVCVSQEFTLLRIMHSQLNGFGGRSNLTMQLKHKTRDNNENL